MNAHNIAAVPTIGDNSASYGEMIAEDPNIVFRDEKALPGLIAEIEAEIEALPVDLETDTGRKAIASLAYSISKRKTPIDKAGLARGEEHRKAIAAIQVVRNEATTKLDALRDKARAPLTAWEVEDDKRKERLAGIIVRLDDIASSGFRDTASLDQAEGWVRSLAITKEEFGGFYDRACEAFSAAVATMESDRKQIAEWEAERAELEELRKLKAEREAQEAAEAAKARQEAEAQRIKDEAAHAAQRAAQAAIDKAEAERAAAVAEAERIKQQALRDAERREAERLAEIKRIEDEKRAAEEEEARRARSRKLVADALGRTKAAIMAVCATDEETAVAITRAIHKGQIPGVTLKI